MQLLYSRKKPDFGAVGGCLNYLIQSLLLHIHPQRHRVGYPMPARGKALEGYLDHLHLLYRQRRWAFVVEAVEQWSDWAHFEALSTFIWGK